MKNDKYIGKLVLPITTNNELFIGIITGYYPKYKTWNISWLTKDGFIDNSDYEECDIKRRIEKLNSLYGDA